MMPEITVTQNLVAERTVLRAALVSQEALFLAMEGLQSKSFAAREHQDIFDAILSLRDRSIAVSVFSVADELRRKGSSPEAADTLPRLVGSGRGYESAIEDVRDAAVKRELSELAFRIAHDVSTPTMPAGEILAKVDQRLVEIAAQTQSRKILTWSEITSQYKQHLHDVCERGFTAVTGLATGLTGLDFLTAGFQKSDLVIVAARPSMGKTSLALTVARNVANDGKKVAFFSLEMSVMQLAMQITAAETKTPINHLRTGNVTSAESARVHQFFAEERGIFIDDSPTLTPIELRAKAAQLHHRYDIDLVLVDYLQLMHAPKAESREREISTISRYGKVLAKELNIPVVMLSQLNREAEKRTDKRPQLSDLRESGSIEQDADVVIFCYRPEYYKITHDEENRPTDGLGYLIIAKQRQGPTGEKTFHFHKEYAAWENIAENLTIPPPSWHEKDEW